MGQIKAIFAIMSNAERRTALRIIALLFLVGLIEMIGVSSILPFVAMLSSPSLIQENDILHYVYDSLGFVEQLDFFSFSLVGLSLSCYWLRSSAKVFSFRTDTFRHEA